MDKNRLDILLELHKAQPIGYGYIDIIVLRENYVQFINDLIQNGYLIKSISWWEWCPQGKECEYGLGGPKSIFHDGWFSELPVDIDDIKIDTNLKNEDEFEKIKYLIENKTIKYPKEIMTFKQNNWLTPAIWLDVPNDWRNKYCKRSRCTTLPKD